MKKFIWKKGRKKLYIIVSAATAAAVTGGVLYVNGRKTQVMAADSSGQDVQETTATTGTVSNSITGTGTLTSVEGDAVTIPSGLTITEVNVSAGDTVSAGDVLAAVDHSSVISAMSSVQSEIDAVDEQIAAITDDSETEDVTAGVSGTVTAVYASEGTSVMDTMSSSGALVEIAVDGDTDNIVQVTATDGTVSEIDVAVGDTVDTGDTLLTVDIDSSSEEYTDLMAQRSELTSELQELVKIAETDEITATEDGTIAVVNVSASSSSSSTSSAAAGSQGTGTTASAAADSQGTGTTASAVTASSGSSGDAGSSETAETADASTGNSVQAVLANYVTVVTSENGSKTTTGTAASDSQNTNGTTETVTADSQKTDGTTETASQDSQNADGATENASQNSQNTDETAGKAISFAISSASSGNDAANAFVLTAPAAGASPVTELSAADGSWTASVVWTDASGNVVSSSDTFGYSTTYRAGITVTPAEGYSLDVSSIASVSGYTVSGITENDDGTLTFVLTAPATAAEGTSRKTTGTDSTGKSEKTSDGSDTETSDNSAGTGSSGSAASGNMGTPETSGGSEAAGTGGASVASGTSGTSGSSAVSTASASTASSDSTSDSTDTDTSESAASSASEITAFTMQSEDTMMISVSVDEQDINSVSVGQSATVTMDALEDVTLDGTVTAVSNSASSSGNGSAKYTVSISVPRQDGMLIGMSASATIVVDEAEDVVTIPVDALQEKGSETYVYTSVDSDGNLSGETEVETGLSDGDTVEITDGLSDGDIVYYEKTGNTSSSGSAGGMGGEMPSGDMPSGGGDMGGGQSSGGAPSGNMPSGGGNMGGGAPSGS